MVYIPVFIMKTPATSPHLMQHAHSSVTHSAPSVAWAPDYLLVSSALFSAPSLASLPISRTSLCLFLSVFAVTSCLTSDGSELSGLLIWPALLCMLVHNYFHIFMVVLILHYQISSLFLPSILENDWWFPSGSPASKSLCASFKSLTMIFVLSSGFRQA